jgi:hypothetical protein
MTINIILIKISIYYGLVEDSLQGINLLGRERLKKLVEKNSIAKVPIIDVMIVLYPR